MSDSDIDYFPDDGDFDGGLQWLSVSEQSSERPIQILLVEDNPGDVRLTEVALENARVSNDLQVVRNGAEALDFLHQRGEYADAERPDIVLLDLNLPRTSGFDVLEEIKSHAELKQLPVIVLTSSGAEEDVLQSYHGHANAFLTKPVDADEFVALARGLGEFWTQMAELPPGAE